MIFMLKLSSLVIMLNCVGLDVIRFASPIINRYAVGNCDGCFAVCENRNGDCALSPRRCAVPPCFRSSPRLNNILRKPHRGR